MRSTIVTTIACFSNAALATPHALSDLFSRENGPNPRCLSKNDALALADTYRQVISEFDRDYLEENLADDFADYSDSINMLTHKPIGSATFNSKDNFIASSENGLHVPLNILSTDVVDCQSIAVQWDTVFGQTTLPTKGVTIVTAAWEDKMWKISRIFVEFNTLAFLLSLGGSYTWQGQTYTAQSPDPATLPV